MKNKFLLPAIIYCLSLSSFLSAQNADERTADSIKANDYKFILLLGYQFLEPSTNDLYGFYPVLGGSVNLFKSKLVHIPLELMLYYTNWDKHLIVSKLSSGVKFIPGTPKFNIIFQGGIGIPFSYLIFPYDIHIGMGVSFHPIQIEFRKNFYFDVDGGFEEWPMFTIILGIQI